MCTQNTLADARQIQSRNANGYIRLVSLVWGSSNHQQYKDKLCCSCIAKLVVDGRYIATRNYVNTRHTQYPGALKQVMLTFVNLAFSIAKFTYMLHYLDQVKRHLVIYKLRYNTQGSCKCFTYVIEFFIHLFLPLATLFSTKGSQVKVID